jgi:hypothetical protein
MNLVDRVKNILLSPKDEWPRIAAEPATTQSLYAGYILILAAIGPAATMVRSLGFGNAVGLPLAIALYVMTLVGTLVLALIVDLLAPTFGGERNFVGSLKLVAYAYTAAWIAGIFRLIPGLAGIIELLASLYSLYTLYLGLAPVKKCPPDKAVAYTIVILICNIVLFWVLGIVLLPTLGLGALAI